MEKTNTRRSFLYQTTGTAFGASLLATSYPSPASAQTITSSQASALKAQLQTVAQAAVVVAEAFSKTAMNTPSGQANALHSLSRSWVQMHVLFNNVNFSHEGSFTSSLVNYMRAVPTGNAQNITYGLSSLGSWLSKNLPSSLTGSEYWPTIEYNLRALSSVALSHTAFTQLQPIHLYKMDAGCSTMHGRGTSSTCRQMVRSPRKRRFVTAVVSLSFNCSRFKTITIAGRRAVVLRALSDSSGGVVSLYGAANGLGLIEAGVAAAASPWIAGAAIIATMLGPAMAFINPCPSPGYNVYPPMLQNMPPAFGPDDTPPPPPCTVNPDGSCNGCVSDVAANSVFTIANDSTGGGGGGAGYYGDWGYRGIDDQEVVL